VKTITRRWSGRKWCLLELKSHRNGGEDASATADNGGDFYHAWMVGVL
jgi:hypothetical protein